MKLIVFCALLTLAEAVDMACLTEAGKMASMDQANPCSEANKALFDGVVKACAGDDAQSKQMALAAKTQLDTCNDPCFQSGMKMAKMDQANPCSDANKALFDDIAAKCKDAADPSGKGMLDSAKKMKESCANMGGGGGGGAGGSGGSGGGGGGMGNPCDSMPEEMKGKCKAAMATCDDKPDGEKPQCMADALKGVLRDMMASACDKAPEDKREQCKTTLAECATKATEAESKKCVAEAMAGMGMGGGGMGGPCDGMPEEMKGKCKTAMATCDAKPDGEKPKCMADAMKAVAASMMAAACDKAPEDKKEQCKTKMAECAAKETEAESKKCMEGAMAVMGDPCDNLDNEAMQKKCRAAMAECKAKGTDDEKKKCMQGKAEALMKEMKAKWCEMAPKGTPEAMKKKCKEAQAACDAKKDEAEKKTCYDAFQQKFKKEMEDNMKKNYCEMAPDEAMKKKCKDTKAACEAKTNEEEKAKCIKAAMDKAMEEMKGGGGKKPEDGKKPDGGKKPEDGKKPDGAKKPVRKKRPVAQKGTDCTKIPKKADLDKDKCVANKDRLWACAKRSLEQVKQCATLRKLKTRKIKKKLVKFAQKVKGIDFSNDEKKAKYEKTVLKLFKAVSGIFTYKKDGARMRRKLEGAASYTVSADLNTNSDEDADAGKAVDDAAIAAELKKDDDFKDVTVEAPTVTVEEVEVEEVIEEASADDAKETTAAPGDESGVSGSATATMTVFALGLAMMAL